MSVVYIGCRTTKERGGQGKGISVYRTLQDGTWELIQIQEQINPSFLCLDRTGKYLYAIHGDHSEITSYAICEQGKLMTLNTVSTGGTNPVHLSVDRTNRWIFVANLQTGSVAVLPRRTDGTLGDLKHLYFIAGNGGPGYISHPHQVQQDPSGDYLIVSAQGRLQGVGQVVVFHIDHDTGALTQVHSVRARTGAEPRHCVFDASGTRCYGANEKSYTVTQYEFTGGQLKPLRIVQTLFEEQIDEGWSSGIAIHPNGRFLYVSDRKQNMVSCFLNDGESGAPKLMSTTKTMGGQPRFIEVSPDGKSLVAANELGHSIYEFPIDQGNGSLGPGVLRAETGSPVCVIWGKDM